MLACAKRADAPFRQATLELQVQAMVEQAVAGLRASRTPEPALEGMGGSYFLSDESGHKACVFKPCDEEPLAPNNPKQVRSHGLAMCHS